MILIIAIFALFGFLMGAVFGFLGAPFWATTLAGAVCGFIVGATIDLK